MADSSNVVTFKPKMKKSFVSYCPEWNMFVYANQQRTPKFCSHQKFLGGVKCLKSGNKLRDDIKADQQFMNRLYKPNNPYVPHSNLLA
mmetsp:Transcript_58386/g.92803  ORF Transcript_58386/g.92803 Transcript_58386/m.92803 type:complete len:88 (-) Transcript_58386:676-939(-)